MFLPLVFVGVVGVRSARLRTREGEGGLPSPADGMGNNDPLFTASSIVPENPFSKEESSFLPFSSRYL